MIKVDLIPRQVDELGRLPTVAIGPQAPWLRRGGLNEWHGQPGWSQILPSSQFGVLTAHLVTGSDLPIGRSNLRIHAAISSKLSNLCRAATDLAVALVGPIATSTLVVAQ